ncbi:MAG: integration host factor subunit beta [Fuerstiella sp.]|nr:integration host factor subunit beta [Fuerstiella sp.]
MTKKEIVKAISEELGLTQLKTKQIVQKTFDAIVETLVTDHRIELRNFGVFEVKKRAARKARNPRTGGAVEVPAKFVVTFKPGKEMEERVRELEIAENARLQAIKTAESSTDSQQFSTGSQERVHPPGTANSQSPGYGTSSTQTGFNS